MQVEDGATQAAAAQGEGQSELAGGGGGVRALSKPHNHAVTASGAGSTGKVAVAATAGASPKAARPPTPVVDAAEDVGFQLGADAVQGGGCGPRRALPDVWVRKEAEDGAEGVIDRGQVLVLHVLCRQAGGEVDSAVCSSKGVA